MSKTSVNTLFITIFLLFASFSAMAQNNVPPAVVPPNPADNDPSAVPPQTGNLQKGILIPPPPQAEVKEDPNSPGLLDPRLPLPDFRIIDNPNDSGGKMLIYSNWKMRNKAYTPEQFQDLQGRVDHIWLTRADSINGNYENVFEIPLDRDFSATDEIGDKSVFYRIKAEKGNSFKYSLVVGPVRAIDNRKSSGLLPASDGKSSAWTYIAAALSGLVLCGAVVFVVVRRRKIY